jgi:hypothetical protein
LAWSRWRPGASRWRLGAIRQQEAVATDFLRLGAAQGSRHTLIYCCFAFSDVFKVLF